MMDWRAVRSITELKLFQIEFNGQSDEQKEEIITEMLLALAVYREKDSQTDLFTPRQVEKPLSKKRRARRKYLSEDPRNRAT